MGLTNHLSCVYDAFYSYRVYFSSGMCAFPFYSENSVCHVSGVGSGLFFPTGIKSIGDDEMVKCVFVLTRINSIVDVIPIVVFVPIGIESKVGRLIEIFSRLKY